MRAGLRVDLDLADMRAVRIGVLLALDTRRSRCSFALVLRAVRRARRRRRARSVPTTRAVPSDKLDVADAGLQLVGGELLDLLGELPRGAVDGGHAERDGARAAGAAAASAAHRCRPARRGCGRSRGRAARRRTAHRRSGAPARVDCVPIWTADGAVRLEHRLGRLGAPEGADLDVGGEAEAADAAACARLSASRASKLPAPRRGERLVHVGGELAGVVDAAGRRLVGHLLRLDEIAPADLGRRKAGRRAPPRPSAAR